MKVKVNLSTHVLSHRSSHVHDVNRTFRLRHLNHAHKRCWYSEISPPARAKPDALFLNRNLPSVSKIRKFLLRDFAAGSLKFALYRTFAYHPRINFVYVENIVTVFS